MYEVYSNGKAPVFEQRVQSCGMFFRSPQRSAALVIVQQYSPFSCSERVWSVLLLDNTAYQSVSHVSIATHSIIAVTGIVIMMMFGLTSCEIEASRVAKNVGGLTWLGGTVASLPREYCIPQPGENMFWENPVGGCNIFHL